MPNWDVMKQKAMGTFDPGDYYSGKSGPLGLLGKGIKAVENFTTNQNQYQDIMDKLSARYEELSDPNSEYYQEFRQNLMKTLSAAAPTTNSLLGMARAGGLGVGSSATIANEQRKATEGRIADYAGKATTGAYLEGSGQANQILQAGLSGNLSYQQLMEQMRQFNESQPTMGDYIGGGLATAGGLLLGGN